ncbi:hypothetical protein C7B80_28140 [Cyanosarcina cf. burmensis CCALA 770]|nr:hypothetical protein C7B80_28140 [Cyanosarcina cf. burmensis CCALA 770]
MCARFVPVQSNGNPGYPELIDDPKVDYLIVIRKSEKEFFPEDIIGRKPIDIELENGEGSFYVYDDPRPDGDNIIALTLEDENLGFTQKIYEFQEILSKPTIEGGTPYPLQPTTNSPDSNTAFILIVDNETPNRRTLGTNKAESFDLRGSRRDTVFAGTGNDIVNAGEGDDIVFGQQGNDTLRGGKGKDTLIGGEDIDTLIGGDGNDFLYGEDGKDTLIGGKGKDTLIGGKGKDTLTGGEGADLFQFNFLTEGIDKITDFQLADGDKIQILGGGFGVTSTSEVSRFRYNRDSGALLFDDSQFAQLLQNLSGLEDPSRFIEIIGVA